MTSIYARSTKGQLIELGIGLLPEVIAALKSKNPNLPEILAGSDEFADTLVDTARNEKKNLESA